MGFVFDHCIVDIRTKTREVDPYVILKSGGVDYNAERWESLIRKVVSLMVVFIILRNHNSHIGGPGVLLECWSVVCHALVKGPSVLCGHIE